MASHEIESMYRVRRAPSNSDERKRFLTSWNGNAQGVTNDSNEEYLPSVKIVDGYPVVYSCESDLPSQSQPVDGPLELIDFELQFDYEFVMSADADVSENLKSLEWSILWNVAETIGLHDCDLTVQNPPDGSRRLRRMDETQNDYVVTLSSQSTDQIDRSTGGCTFLTDNKSGQICTPVQGFMTARYTGKDPSVIKDFLLDNIAAEMDSGRVRIDDVTKVRYIGDRGAGIVAVSKVDLTRAGFNFVLWIVVVAIPCLMIIVLTAYFRMHLLRRQRMVEDQPGYTLHPSTKDEKVEHPVIVATETDEETLEAGEAIPQSNSDQENEAEQENSLETEAPIAEEEKIDNEENDREEENSVSSDASEGSVSSDTTVSPSSSDDTEGAASQDVQLSGLENVPIDSSAHRPPLPPGPPSESLHKERGKSKTLQSRRKRKKKKKPTLKRVSSKSSIDEMETIREVDEAENEGDEGSEYTGSEYGGSEYSTDDEEEMLHVITNSTISSDCSDVVSPLGKSQQFGSSAGSPPSPIREEPKIRKIPPPWI